MPKGIIWYKREKISSGKSATILFSGDFCPIRRYEEKILDNQPVFNNSLRAIMRDKDLFIVNLETPLLENSKGVNENGMCASDKIGLFMKQLGIDIAALANNHIRDQGDEGVLSTIKVMKKNSIIPIGAGKNMKEANKFKTCIRNGLKIGIWNLAEKEFNLATDERPGSGYFLPEANVYEIPGLREKVDFLILYVHAGHEFVLTPSPRIRRAYRSFIDAGADVVVGHHPHVVQGIEKYRKGWIFYSLGNFIFDSPYVSQHNDTDHGFLLKTEIRKHTIDSVTLFPYKLHPEIMVKLKSPAQAQKYKKFLKEISLNIKDEEKFMHSWENHVRKRISKVFPWFMNFSENIKKHSTRKLIHNTFNCPTSLEVMTSAFENWDRN